MTVLQMFVEADLAIVPDATYVAPRPVVAMAPSAADPEWDEMRIAVGLNGVNLSRAFDPGDDIDTGAPVPYVTMAGDAYVTVAGDPYVTVVE